MEKLVSLTLNTASFLVKGANDKELLENAKKAMIEQLQNGQFPSITYGINDADSLTFNNVLPGMIVESTSDRKLGIVTGVNKKTINVTYKNFISVQGNPNLFKLSNATFEEARSERDKIRIEDGFWDTGYSGYLHNNGNIYEVVVGKITKGKAKVHVVNSSSVYAVPEDKLSSFIKDKK